jgi:hypothetical protein
MLLFKPCPNGGALYTILIVVLLLSQIVTCQLTIPPTFTCIDPGNVPVVTETACASLRTSLSSCKSSTIRTDYQNCVCHQELFNNILDCESENRLCLRNQNDDYVFESLRTEFHTICGTLSVTTPVLSSITSTRCLDNCKLAVTACQRFLVHLDSCLDAFPDAETNTIQDSSLRDCGCATSALSLSYVCQSYCPFSYTGPALPNLSTICPNMGAFMATVSCS